MDIITQEHTRCGNCGGDVIYRDGLAVDVLVGGEFGQNVIDCDTEHECEI